MESTARLGADPRGVGLGHRYLSSRARLAGGSSRSRSRRRPPSRSIRAHRLRKRPPSPAVRARQVGTSWSAPGCKLRALTPAATMPGLGRCPERESRHGCHQCRRRRHGPGGVWRQALRRRDAEGDQHAERAQIKMASPGLMKRNRVERRAVVVRNAVGTARRDARTSAQAARRRGSVWARGSVLVRGGVRARRGIGARGALAARARRTRRQPQRDRERSPPDRRTCPTHRAMLTRTLADRIT